jgi:hypothetical protein
MPTSRPFAYNPSPNPLISGTTQVGDIAIGVNSTLDYFGGAGGVQWWQGPDEDLGYIVAKPIPPLTQPNPLNIPAGVAFGRSLFTEQSFIGLAESLSSGTTFATGNDASTWLTDNGYWNTWIFITPTPTPTLTQTPTLTPTLTQTPTPTLDLFLGSLVSCSNQGGSPTNEMYLPTLYYPYTIGPFSGWYATTVIDTLGDCYYVIGLSSPGALPQLTWGGTNTSSWVNYYNQGQYSGCTQCISTPTPTQETTPTPTATPTVTPTQTPTVTPTNTQTPTSTSTQTPTNTVTNTQTPTNTETPTQTPTPTITDTPTQTPTNTPTPTVTETPTNTPTPTVTETPTNTPTPANTETPTNTPTPTVTETPTNTPTNTPTPTNTETPTQTPTNTPTPTVTETPTNTQTPTNTETPTNTVTPTQTPTNTETPTNTPTPTVTNTPTGTPASTPAPPPPPPGYYYMSPNSFVPPTIGASPINNYLITDQPLSTIISTSDIDYTTTNWSFSVWGNPTFDYTSFTPNDDYISVLYSLAVPVGGGNLSPNNASTNLTVGVLYNSGVTLVNDLVVWMRDDAGLYAKWTWSINQDTNQFITGLNSTKMWDKNNKGSTLNTQQFSNIVISHNESLVIPNASGSTKAYWNGQELTLKSYTQPDAYPHITSYASLDDTRFYIASGSKLGTSVTQFLSTNTDNPTYYPLTTLSQSDAVTLYNGGTVLPLIPGNPPNTAYIWNFDDTPNHIQCLNSTNTSVSQFDLLVFDSTAPNEVTFTLI